MSPTSRIFVIILEGSWQGWELTVQWDIIKMGIKPYLVWTPSHEWRMKGKCKKKYVRSWLTPELEGTPPCSFRMGFRPFQISYTFSLSVFIESCVYFPPAKSLWATFENLRNPSTATISEINNGRETQAADRFSYLWTPGGRGGKLFCIKNIHIYDEDFTYVKERDTNNVGDEQL